MAWFSLSNSKGWQVNPNDWMDEGQAFAEDIYEDEGDGISEYLGEPIEVFGDDDD
jgi:hypothetical protein